MELGNLKVFVLFQILGFASSEILRITTGRAQFLIEVSVANSTGFPTKLEGLGADLMDWLSRKVHAIPVITKFYPTMESLIGSTSTFFFVNGTWAGAVGDLEHNKSDVIISTAAAKSAYIPHVHLTFPYIESSYSMFIPYPENESNTWAVVKPFQLWVWILLFVSLILVSVIMWLLVNTKYPGQTEYGIILLYFVTVITAQGGSWQSKAQHCIALGVAWCLASVVLVNAYNGLLTSHMTITKPKPIATSLEDLLSPNVKFYVNNNTYIYSVLMQATTGIEKKLGDVLRREPDRVTTTVPECLEKTQKGPNACLMVTEVGLTYMGNTFQISGKCQTTKAGPTVVSFNPVLIVRKDYILAEAINQGVTHLRSFGMETGWARKQRKGGNACPLKQTESARLEKLQLRHVSGAFVVLFTGISAASVCFITERLVYRFTARKPSCKA